MADKSTSSRRNKSVTTTTERIRDLEEVINGNGSIGLKGKAVQLDTQFDALKEDIKDVKENVAEVKEGQKWAMRFALMQAIAFVAAVVIYIVNNG